MFVDSNVSNAPIEAVMSCAGAEYLRNLDCTKWEFRFRGSSYPIRKILDEMQEIEDRAKTWLQSEEFGRLTA